MPNPFPDAFCAATLIPLGNVFALLVGSVLLLGQPRWAMQLLAFIGVVALVLWTDCSQNTESFKTHYYGLLRTDPSAFAFNEGFCHAKHAITCMPTETNATRRSLEEVTLDWSVQGCVSDNELNATVVAGLEAASANRSEGLREMASRRGDLRVEHARCCDRGNRWSHRYHSCERQRSMVITTDQCGKRSRTESLLFIVFVRETLIILARRMARSTADANFKLWIRFLPVRSRDISHQMPYSSSAS